MKKLLLPIVFMLMPLFIISCSSRTTVTENDSKQVFVSKAAEVAKSITPSLTAKPGPFLSPTNTIIGNDKPSLSQEKKEKLGILIKWIYDINLVQSGDDEQNLQLPEKIRLLPTDTEKIRFVTDMVAVEHITGDSSDNRLTYTFTEEEADALVYSAVGERFAEHKASDYVSGYSDGIYSYSMVGGDGAAWWPDIDISKWSCNSENEILIQGVLKSKHDVYSKEYSFNFEAVAVTNAESLFGGYTLKGLKIY